MIEYTVRVFNGITLWYLNGKLHREDGPAMEFSNGLEFWYLDGQALSKEAYNARMNTFENKILEIDGKKYRLEEV